ncbi:MAG: dihydroorotase [Candidatus Kerfeldbacteria bacterium]|nr:dihydroorotase [Candidatus Kerfeldbacteria bacterium]
MSGQQFARALVMPNTAPPIFTGVEASRYRAEIARAGTSLTPLLSIYLTSPMPTQIIRDAREHGVVAAKLYPAGATVNSQNGVRDIESLVPAFEAMAELGMVLCVHGEDPEKPVLERERCFLDWIEWITRVQPDLKIVLEHISSAEAVECVLAQSDNVAATITTHHLVLTLDDVLGSGLRPHSYCKPIPKDGRDRNALRDAATSGHPRFFFGSDSAPHPKSAKESADAPPGIFSSPVALPLLATIFEEMGRLDRLEDFTSRFGAAFYGLPLTEERLVFVREEWTVPERYGPFVPFLAGQTLPWRVAE